MNTLKTFGEVTVTFDHQILNQTDPVDVWVPICRNALRNTFFFFFQGLSRVSSHTTFSFTHQISHFVENKEISVSL